jgi:hypothetical protein
MLYLYARQIDRSRSFGFSVTLLEGVGIGTFGADRGFFARANFKFGRRGAGSGVSSCQLDGVNHVAHRDDGMIVGSAFFHDPLNDESTS